MGLKILLAEDEEALSKVYAAALRHKGHQVVQAYNGEEALQYAEKEVFDLHIFDIMMPIMTGLETLREIRQAGNKTYTILLTAMGEIEDKVTGLDAGADDYLTKPISLKELLARVDSLTRRMEQYTEKVLTAGCVTLNVAQQELSVSNAVRLSSKEAQLMEVFMRHMGKELSTSELYNKVWGIDKDPEIDEGYVYIYVSYLRQKLRSIQADIDIIGQEGRSYRLERRED
ncbi:response regulator transcription factor [Streptococcus sp. DD13]|uniref:response regulator transcription factor n=1 Tax=Streptococcus sp. DD13 TaxID=1777881 RepID=UPI0007972526|nr:response regulator transcription factor [Streptococcus sp. DD13]KXT78346.1 Regulation of D-alanyl-lipoteichoic acid biosynthesis, DltR [Streptococcus sp. DD13]